MKKKYLHKEEKDAVYSYRDRNRVQHQLQQLQQNCEKVRLECSQTTLNAT